MNVMTPLAAANSFRQWRDYDRPITAPELYFYHTMELPEPVGVAKGHWDLRGGEDAYLGYIDFRNKSVFDCGIASGFMAFEMEKRGARVTGLDLDETRCEKMGLIPFHDFEQRFGFSYETAIAHRKEGQARLRNSFLYARGLKKSNVDLYVGDIMKDQIVLPKADIALFGCILLHLNDPLAALYNVAQHVQETIIVTELVDGRNLTLNDPPSLTFRPNIREGANPGTWTCPNPSWLKTVLEVVGFTKFDLQFGVVKDDSGQVDIFSLVANRR